VYVESTVGGVGQNSTEQSWHAYLQSTNKRERPASVHQREREREQRRVSCHLSNTRASLLFVRVCVCACMCERVMLCA